MFPWKKDCSACYVCSSFVENVDDVKTHKLTPIGHIQWVNTTYFRERSPSKRTNIAVPHARYMTLSVLSSLRHSVCVLMTHYDSRGVVLWACQQSTTTVSSNTQGGLKCFPSSDSNLAS